MSYGKKMTLVPLDMMENFVKNSTLAALQQPNKEYLLKKIDSVNDLNENKDLPDNIKANRLAQNIKEVSIMANKSFPSDITQPPISKPDDLLDNYEKRLENIPKTYQRSAKALLKELKQHQDRFQIDQNTNEITIDGTKLTHSNLIDLISDMSRPRKRAIPPMYTGQFLKLLADLNVPEEMIGNKARVINLRKYKTNKNDNQLEQEQMNVEKNDDNNAFAKNELYSKHLKRRSYLMPKLTHSRIKKINSVLQNKSFKRKQKYSWKKV